MQPSLSCPNSTRGTPAIFLELSSDRRAQDRSHASPPGFMHFPSGCSQPSLSAEIHVRNASPVSNESPAPLQAKTCQALRHPGIKRGERNARTSRPEGGGGKYQKMEPFSCASCDSPKGLNIVGQPRTRKYPTTATRKLTTRGTKDEKVSFEELSLLRSHGCSTHMT